MLLLARFLELRSRRRDSGAWIDAQSHLPVTVTLRQQNQWVQAPRQDIQPGDRLLVTAGSVFPADGEVLTGSSAAREEAFSGESLPRDLVPGDSVFAGTVNIESAVEIRSYGSYADGAAFAVLLANACAPLLQARAIAFDKRRSPAVRSHE